MNVRIVVADDNPDIVLVISERLRWLGYEVFAAADGQAALSAVMTHSPDLVLLDIGMPCLSGLEVLTRIRRQWPNLPVVIVTAYNSVQMAVDAMREGAVDFITKPFENQQLDAVVARALANYTLKVEMTQLLGEISHDVKNMLMPLLTGTELLEEELAPLSAKYSAEMAHTKVNHLVCEEVIALLRSSSTRIHERLKEIADYVALSRIPQAVAPCRVEKIAEDVVKALGVVAGKKRLALHVNGLEELPPIVADQNRLYAMLFNLVNNAIPEVPAGGSITIGGTHDAAEEIITLTVQDTGAGMPPEIRDSLFTRRIVSRKAYGTGLGIKIVKDIVEAHGGHIMVESEQGKGTCFHIRLPLSPPADSYGQMKKGAA